MSNHEHNSSCHSSDSEASGKKKIDMIFWGSSILLLFLLATHFFGVARKVPSLVFLAEPAHMAYTTFVQFLPGILLGVFFACIIGIIPMKVTQKAFGNDKNIFISLIRAVGFGLLFDVCNHGVLFLAQKFYKQGIKTPSVIAFLVSTPWNSFTLTILLFMNIGSFYAPLFIILSMLIAISTGFIVDRLIKKGVLPANQNQLIDLEEENNKPAEPDSPSCCSHKVKKNPINNVFKTIWETILESRSILKWIFFGIILSVFIRSIFGEENFSKFFAPTMLGLLATLFLATIIEACSEGTLALGIDLFTIAKAKGNSFAFMMSGVATDFTEFMVLKELTGSKKLAFLVLIILIVQVVLIAAVLNKF